MKIKRKLPTYMKKLINKYPRITSGRKNFTRYHSRILKTLELIKKYKDKTSN